MSYTVDNKALACGSLMTNPRKCHSTNNYRASVSALSALGNGSNVSGLKRQLAGFGGFRRGPHLGDCQALAVVEGVNCYSGVDFRTPSETGLRLKGAVRVTLLFCCGNGRSRENCTGVLGASALPAMLSNR